MRINRNNIFNIAVSFIAIFAILLGGYFYYQLKNVKSNVTEDGKKNEIKSLVDKVSKLYLTPKDEEPTIATVSDPEILKNQSFFTLSEKGDKVLIFKKSGRAVLYRPSIDKIIEIAPIKNNSTSTPNIKEDVTTVKEKSKTITN